MYFLTVCEPYDCNQLTKVPNVDEDNYNHFKEMLQINTTHEAGGSSYRRTLGYVLYHLLA
jgi:hypothetical protein